MKFSILFFLLLSARGFGQLGSFSYIDPAQVVNKMILEGNSNNYYRIGNYKVTGTPYLYGEDVHGDLHAKDILVDDAIVRYNVFTQKIEYDKGGNKMEVSNDLDSFFLRPANYSVAKFVWGQLIGETPAKNYFQEILVGKKYSLYKRYEMKLEIVTTNYVQSELRQFDLQYEYFYTDNTNGVLKKIKPTYKGVVNEFKQVPDLKKAIAENFVNNPEIQLVNAFTFLNQ